MKKKLWILIGLGILVVLSSAIIYWFYFSKPVTFPTNEQLVEEINSIFPEAAASVIQDTIPIDEHHVVVPFISDKEDYSLSYWVWQKGKWSAESIHSNTCMYLVQSHLVSLWLKIESTNPTGSFKVPRDDGRGLAGARTQGATAVVCASTGNTAASAAYAARAGMTAEILFRKERSRSASSHRRARSARACRVARKLDESLRRPGARRLGKVRARELAQSGPDRGAEDGPRSRSPRNSDALPDVLALPYGGGGNTRAYARGFGRVPGRACRASSRARRCAARPWRPRSASSILRIAPKLRRRFGTPAARSSR